MACLVMVWCFAALTVLAGGTETASSRSLAANANWANVNKVLRSLQIGLNLTEVPGITQDGRTISFKEGSYCTNVTLQSASVLGTSSPNVVIEGKTYEQFDIALGVDNIGFACVVPIHLLTKDGQERDGSVLVKSPSLNDVNLAVELFSPSFALNPPVFAKEKQQSCPQKVSIKSLTFEVSGLRPGLGGLINMNAQVQDALTKESASVIQLLSEFLCNATQGVTGALGGFLVESNPINDYLRDLVVSRDSLEELALAAEERVSQNGPEIKLVNIQDNFVVDLLVGEPEEGQSKGEALFEAAAQYLNISIPDGSNPLFAVADSLLGTDFAKTAGVVTDLELIEFLRDKLPSFDLSKFLGLNFTVPNLGSLEASIKAVRLTTTSPAANQEVRSQFDLVGGHSILLPGVAFGRLGLSADVSIKADLATQFSGSSLAYAVQEDFSVQLEWLLVLAEIGLGLPIDQDAFTGLQIGPLFRALQGCLTSAFFRAPGVSAARVGGDTARVMLSKIDDGLVSLLGDLVNNVINPIYKDLASTWATVQLRSWLSTLTLFDKGSCPVVEQTPASEVPYDFATSDLVAQIKSFLPSNVTDALKSLLAGFEGKEKDSIEIISSPLSLAQVPLQNDQSISLTVRSVTLGNVVPPALGNLVLLDTRKESPYYPQGLFNLLSAGSESRPVLVKATVELNATTPKGTSETNVFSAQLSLSNFTLAAEIFAAYSVYGFESTPLREMLQLDCWVGKLRAFGGLKELTIALGDVKLELKCAKCENEFLGGLFDFLNKPSTMEYVTGFFNTDVGPLLSDYVTAPFSEDRWQATVTAAKQKCSRSFQPSSAPASTRSPIPETEQALSSTYSFLGLLVGAVSLAGCFSLGCDFRAKTPASVLSDDKKASKATPEASSENDLVKVDLESKPLWNHPSIPVPVKALVPVLLLSNFALFLLGHVDVVLSASAEGKAAGFEFSFPNFSNLSVILTVKDLWEGQAYFLAIMIGVLSVIWPYVKLIGMAFSWFAPARLLSFKRRGSLVTTLDQLGKWSLVELYFVILCFVLLEIRFVAPEVLPQGIYEFALIIDSRYNLYTFTVALLVSLALSNVMVVYHDRIEDIVLQVQRARAGMESQDAEKISLMDSIYEDLDARGVAYRVRLTRAGATVFVVGVLSTLGAYALAASVDTLRLEFYGLARVFLDLGGNSTQQQVSLAAFVADSFSPEKQKGVLFACAFLLTVVIIPVVQILMLLAIPFTKFTLKGALRYLEINQILSAWSAVEVFVLAVGVASLELKTVSRFLVEDQCSGIQPFMNDLLLPLSLITPVDVEASCLGIQGFLELGAFLFVAAMVLASLVHYLVIKTFEAYIHSRSHRHLAPSMDVEGQSNASTATVGFFVSTCIRLRLLSIDDPLPAQVSTKRFSNEPNQISSNNVLYAPKQ